MDTLARDTDSHATRGSRRRLGPTPEYLAELRRRLEEAELRRRLEDEHHRMAAERAAVAYTQIFPDTREDLERQDLDKQHSAEMLRYAEERRRAVARELQHLRSMAAAVRLRPRVRVHVRVRSVARQRTRRTRVVRAVAKTTSTSDPDPAEPPGQRRASTGGAP